MNNIFEKLTHNMSEAIESAISLALHNKNQEVQVEHFFWALLTNSNSVLNQMFNKMNVDKVAMELDVKSLSEKLPKSSTVSKESIKLSRDFVKTLENGVGLMTKNGDFIILGSRGEVNTNFFITKYPNEMENQFITPIDKYIIDTKLYPENS